MSKRLFTIAKGHRGLWTSRSANREQVDILKTPLNVAVPGIVKPRPTTSAGGAFNPFDTKVTVLPNGLRVASEALPNNTCCTIGVAIDAGSRYEVHYPLGTTHFLQKIAYNSSVNYTNEDVLKITEERGAMLDCQSTRDTFLYAASLRTDGLDDVLGIIADSVLRPLFLEDEITYVRNIVAYENEENLRQPEGQNLIHDWIHTAAFQGNTLGFSRYCDTEAREAVKREHLHTFISQYFTPERIVVAGVGVDHDELVASAEKHFTFDQAIWKGADRLLPDVPPVDQSLAQYTGGEFRLVRDLSKMAPGQTAFPNLAHFVLGFEGAGIKHPDFVPFCVLNSFMGGGGSFSAGGPGKGMFTRLYMDVLYQDHAIYNATAFNNSYNDGGIFAIKMSAPPEHYRYLVLWTLGEFLRLASDVPKEDLERAKIQLKSQIFMNLELRPVHFEDLARQLLSHDRRIKPDEYSDLIDAVTEKDIIRIAERMLHSKPSVVGYGDLKDMPSYEKIADAVAKRSVNALL